jgi:hypothetical protein
MSARVLLRALQQGTTAAGGDGRQLLFAEALDGQRWASQRREPFYGDLLREIQEEGDRLLEVPLPPLPFSLYRSFDTTGEREAYQRLYFERRRRLYMYTVLAMTNDSPVYVDALDNVAWALCDEYTWCLPAHLGGKSLVPDKEADDITGSHRKTLDLFAAETAFALSEMLHLVGHRLSELVVQRVKQEIRQRVLEPYASLRPSSWWESTEMNWAAVCAGSIGASAMYLMADDQTLAPLLSRVLDTLDGFLEGFPEDGACLEGIGYWTYGFGFYVYFAALLKQRTAGQIDLLKGEKVHAIALFQQKSYLHQDAVISYSDAFPTSPFQLGLTHYLQRVFPDVETPAAVYHSGAWGDHCFRFAHAIRNLVWSDPSMTESTLSEGCYVLDQAQILVERGTWNGLPIAFSAKGGHNDEPHNHNDLGSFIWFAGTQLFLVDPGCGVYTKQYFGSERYSLIYNGSQGHSVPIIEGQGQQAGACYSAKLLAASCSEAGTLFQVDLTQAYDLENLQSLTRTFHRREQKLLIADHYVFRTIPSSVIERFVTFLPPEQLQDGTVRLNGEHGVSVELCYSPELMKYSCLRVPFLPETQDRAYLYLMDFEVMEPKKEMAVEILLEVRAR